MLEGESNGESAEASGELGKAPEIINNIDRQKDGDENSNNHQERLLVSDEKVPPKEWQTEIWTEQYQQPLRSFLLDYRSTRSTREGLSYDGITELHFSGGSGFIDKLLRSSDAPFSSITLDLYYGQPYKIHARLTEDTTDIYISGRALADLLAQGSEYLLPEQS